MEIKYEDIKNIYIELKELLETKQKALVKKDIDTLGNVDEKILAINERIKDVDNNKDKFTLNQGQKAELNKLVDEILKIENNNKALINHSLNVIDKIFTGILNIATKNNADYTASGKRSQGNGLEISSIVEEA